MKNELIATSVFLSDHDTCSGAKGSLVVLEDIEEIVVLDVAILAELAYKRFPKSVLEKAMVSVETAEKILSTIDEMDA